MSLSLLEVLFDTRRHLDARFWLEVRARLAEAGYGLFYREDDDFAAEHGWKSVADGHYPEPTTHGFLVCNHPRLAESREARLQVNVYRAWDPHDEPWALPWDPETKLLLTERRARLEVQLLRTATESTEFGEDFVHAAAAALEGVLDDEANGSLTLPDGSIEPYPDEAEERTPSVAELSHPGLEEKTPTEGTPIDAAEDDPNEPSLVFELECRETFTPQHAYDELLRVAKGLLPYKGFAEIRASADWELFGFADKDASGLTIMFRRTGESTVELIFDLYKTFDPSSERIAKVHKVAHAVLDALLGHLDATARKV